MKYSLLTGLILLAACTTGCGEKDDNNNETSITARADSIVGIRMEEINRQAMEDLEKRIAIEVKAKADSIVAARKKTGLTPDSSGGRMAPLVSDADIEAKAKQGNDTTIHK